MRRWIAGLVALACLVTACSSTVAGTGHVGSHGPTPTGSGFPAPTGTSPSGSGGQSRPAPPTGPPGQSRPTTGTTGGSSDAPPPSTTCPHITYPYAHLKFDCITSGLAVPSLPDKVWPLSLQKPVEADWALSEGAGSWGATHGQSLEAITKNVRTQMVAADEYATKPGVRTTSSESATVAGVDAWVLQTTFTINSAYRTQQKLKVKVEKSWIVAITVGAGDVSLWYVTLPDDVKQLWDRVASVIGTIELS